MQVVLRAFRNAGKPLARAELLKALGMHRRDKEDLFQLLGEMLDEGKIIQLKGGTFGLTESMSLVTGVLEVQRSGVGFVIPDDKRRKDIFISPSAMGDARHGDRVAAALMPERKGKRPEGRVARVVERGFETLSAVVSKKLDRYFLCLPTDPRQRISLMVEAKNLPEAPQPGDILMVRPGEKLDRELWSGAAEALLGREDDVLVQEALVKRNLSVPTTFPQSALDEAATLPSAPGQADFKNREDLRALGFVTIDGAKARDFDDAILVEEQGKGYLLRVAIADVSHYVKPGSALDREAKERGNSYYFPQSVEPMFPESLSNGLCSLNPAVPRLVMVAEMRFDAAGTPGEARFYPAVIESKARLTYAQVNRILFLDDQAERAAVAPVLPMLERAERLARLLNAQRGSRGSLDFDLPEPEILFNIHGETVDIRPKVRHFGHQIVEEFMIAANEAVAQFLTDRGKPCLYRIHPEPDPDKLEALFDLVSRTDLAASVPEESSVKGLQALLAAAQGTDLEYMVSRLTLRSMMQAKYSPVNEGHFGLASACYCHFTSPIRRYADLVVHRSLKQVAAEERGDLVPAMRLSSLKTLSDTLSVTERKGMEAEREILKRITILFLRERIGETFTGVINSLADFGFWVELKEVMAEGLVRLSTIHDDYYGLIPERQELLGQRTGKRLRLGQSVKVRLVEVNLSRLEVNLELVEAGGRGRSKSAASPKSSKSKDAGGTTQPAPASEQPEKAAKPKKRRGGKGRGRKDKRRPAGGEG